MVTAQIDLSSQAEGPKKRFRRFAKTKTFWVTLPETKKTSTYPWSIPQTSPNPQMKGIPS